MKFSCEVVIGRPLEEVASLWSNPEHLKEWQEGFYKMELISGPRREADSVAMMHYKNGKREMEIKETVLKNELPHLFAGLYEHTHMVNTMTSRFEFISDNQTRYITDIEYTQFNGIIPKLMAFFFPGMFKKQVQKWLDNFKKIAEGGDKLSDSK